MQIHESRQSAGTSFASRLPCVPLFKLGGCTELHSQMIVCLLFNWWLKSSGNSCPLLVTSLGSAKRGDNTSSLWLFGAILDEKAITISPE